MKRYRAGHMIRPEHLNHHHNLYAGQAIEWMVEASFMAAELTDGVKDGILFRNCHKFEFNKPVLPGEIISYEAMIVRAGTSSITVHVDMISEDTGEIKAQGITTFVTTEPGTTSRRAHNIVLDRTEDVQELEYRKEAEELFR